MSSRQHVNSMPNAIELPEPKESSFGQSDLDNFPEVEDGVKPTQGLIDVAIDFGTFDCGILQKHQKTNFVYAYDTRGDPIRGLCLIINNREFKKLEERIGTDVDCENLKRLFVQLGYDVRAVHNQTADEMKTECQTFIFDKEHAKYSSCVLIILSHGRIGKIYGTDCQLVDEKADILDCFNSRECKLTGKPKLVIVQACRTQLATKHRESQYDAPDGPTAEGDEYSDLVDLMRKLNYKDTAFVSNSLTPDCADLLIAHSTLPGYVSWRHKEIGSWFVQAIVQIFARSFHDEHVADMLVQVNQLVGDAFGQNDSSQMPCPINHLRKKFYFFPNHR